eukprot:gene4843-21169_t
MEANIDGTEEQLKELKDASEVCPVSPSTSKNDLISKNGKRKRKTASQNVVCPVCGLTLRFGEMKEHYEKELSSLDELSDPSSKTSMKWHKRQQSKKSKKQGSASADNEEDEEEEKHKKNTEKRLKEFSDVKCSRRMRYAKILLGKWSSPSDDPSAYHLTKCAICDAPIAGNEEELVSHVQLCLKKKEGDLESDEESGSESLDEYTWAGQTRIRATSLLEPGVYACDGEPIKLETTNEDEELDIESDGQTAFGEAQYTENDVIPCSSEIPEENEALDRIRAAITTNDAKASSPDASIRSRWSNGEASCISECENFENLTVDSNLNESPSKAISSLKSRIIALNDELQKEKLKCLICMGAKKLCPQCSTITSPSDLRKIYI